MFIGGGWIGIAAGVRRDAARDTFPGIAIGENRAIGLDGHNLGTIINGCRLWRFRRSGKLNGQQYVPGITHEGRTFDDPVVGSGHAARASGVDRLRTSALNFGRCRRWQWKGRQRDRLWRWRR